MALLQVTAIPLGTSSPSVAEFVAQAVKVAEASGLSYELTPMSTCLQGPLKEIVRVALQMHEACFADGVQRVVTTITVDDRRDKEATLTEKVETVEAILASE